MATNSQEGVITMTRNNGSITILLAALLLLPAAGLAQPGPAAFARDPKIAKEIDTAKGGTVDNIAQCTQPPTNTSKKDSI